MANAKKCDRCGRLYELHEGLPIIPLGNKYYGMMLIGQDKARSFDLCLPCAASLRMWLGFDDVKPDEKEGDYEDK